MSKLAPITVLTYQTSSPAPGEFCYQKGVVGETPFNKAAALLEYQAGILAFMATRAVAARRHPEFIRAADDRSLYLGPIFFLKRKDGLALASWRVVDEKAGKELEDTGSPYLVSEIEQSRDFRADPNFCLCVQVDSTVRRVLSDFDGKGNTCATATFVGVFDVGAAIAKTITGHFLTEEDQAGYDSSMKEFFFIKAAKGYSHWEQANPFNWRYIPATARDEEGKPILVSEAQSIAAEFFVSNLARVPFVGQKRIYEALLDGDEMPGLSQLIKDTLLDTEVAAKTMLVSLELSDQELASGFDEALKQAAGPHLEAGTPLVITDEAVLKAHEAQKACLTETANKQLRIVELCKKSEACLLAYLLQNITASNEFIPVIEDPSVFAGVKPAEVVRFVTTHLSEQDNEKYAKAIASLVTAVHAVDFSKTKQVACPLAGISLLRQPEPRHSPTGVIPPTIFGEGRQSCSPSVVTVSFFGSAPTRESEAVKAVV